MAAARIPLGELMVQAGLVNAEQLREALIEQQQTGLPLGRILIARGFASSAAVANALADQHGGVLRTEYGVAAGSLVPSSGALRWAGSPHVTTPAVTPSPAGAFPAPSLRAAETSPPSPPPTPIEPPRASPQDETSRRIRVAQPEHRRAFSDYCQRLGARVEDAGNGWMDVSFPADVDDELEPYLASWSATNGAELELLGTTDTHTDYAPAEPTLETLNEPILPPQSSTPPLEDVPALRLAAGTDAQIASGVGAPTPPTVAPTFPRGMRLGDLLVTKGFISQHQLGMALLESQSTGALLGRVLLEKQWLFEDELARCLSEQWNLRFVSLGQLGVERAAARLVPEKVGLQFGAIPVRFTLECVDVAFVDPTDESALEAIDFFVRPFNPVVATLSDITRMWRQVAA